jgi:4-carboxymuconolactone decarboxylase
MSSQRVPNAGFEPALQARLEELWGKPVNLYRALGNHPALVAAWTEFANAIRHDSRTPRSLRELMILRVGQLARSEYEWAHHLRMARKSGVREAQIADLAAWRDSPEYDERERAALALAEAIAHCNVTDEVHAAVRKHFDAAQYVELSMTAGFYALVVRMLDALRVELDEDVRDHAPRL